MADDHRKPNAPEDAATDEKVDSRAAKIAKDDAKLAPEDPHSQAKQMLEESEERVLDPKAGALDDDTVERRNVGDLTPDPEEQ